VQRYGLSRLSYEYIASVLPEIAPAIADGRVIVAHLGSGASLCALKARKSVDSTLGFTALDGLCMGTRPGSMDPGIVLHLFQTMGRSATDVESLLYKQSGLLGISGISNDMRDLLENPESGRAPGRGLLRLFRRQAHGRARGRAGRRGRDRLHRRHRRTIGGDSPAHLRRVRVAGSHDRSTANAAHGPRISTPASRVSAWVVPTNEELMIARHTGALLGIAGRRPVTHH
jgi:acetate kinase